MSTTTAYQVGKTYAVGWKHLPATSARVDHISDGEIRVTLLLPDGSKSTRTSFKLHGGYTNSEEGRSVDWCLGHELSYDTEPTPVGVKLDGGKPMPRLLYGSMPEAVAAVVDVLSFGARKYSDDNWKKVEPHRYIDALYRHLNAHHKGEKVDAESGLPHLAHATCCLLFLLHHEVANEDN